LGGLEANDRGVKGSFGCASERGLGMTDECGLETTLEKHEYLKWIFTINVFKENMINSYFFYQNLNFNPQK